MAEEVFSDNKIPDITTRGSSDRAARLATISRIGRLITSSLNLDELLRTAVFALTEYLPYPTIALMLVDEEEPDTLRLHTYSGVYTQSHLEGYRQHISEGIAGEAAQLRRRLLVNDVRSDPRYIPVIAGEKLRAELAIPLVAGSRLVGLLNIESEDYISEDDASDFEIVADQLAVAIEHARLFQEEQRRAVRISIINRIFRLITGTLSLDHILQTAVEAVHKQLGYASVSVLLTDPDDPGVLVMRARDGKFGREIQPGGYRQSIDRGILGAAARTRQYHLISDVTRDTRYVRIPDGESIKSELAVPLVASDRLLGVLNIESEHRIAPNDVADVEILADQLSVAIDNASRYEEERRRTERLGLIARVGQRIAGRLNADELFSTTVEELHQHMAYDHVALFLVDPTDPGWLVQRARASLWPRGERAGYRQSVNEGILGAAARSRRPQLVNNTTSDPRFIAVPGADGMHAELAVPILRGGSLLGVLDVAGRRPLRQEDMTGIQVVADQLAIAIDHAHLFASTQQALQETRLLYETSRRISAAHTIDEVVRVYLDQVATRGRYACSVAVYEVDDSGAKTAVRVLGRWTPAEGINRQEYPLARTDDDLDPILDTGQTVTIADVDSDPRVSAVLRAIQRESGRPSLAMIPLMVRGKRIGLVVLADTVVHTWSEADLHPYQVTASQLAAAIDSRRQQIVLLEHERQLAVLEERSRLARDLHDSVTQLVFSVTLIAQTIAGAFKRDQAEGERRIEKLLTLSQSALVELRALLAELRPTDPAPLGAAALASSSLRLRQDGLVAVLQQYADEIAQGDLTFEIDASAYQRQSPVREEALLRIAQESINNAIKHGHARRIRVRLALENRAIRLSVADNGRGIGFTTTAHMVDPGGTNRHGFGLSIMRERAEALGGTVRVSGAPGMGTEVDVSIPVDEDR